MMIENLINFIVMFWWVWSLMGFVSGISFALTVRNEKVPALLKIIFAGLAIVSWALFVIAIIIIVIRLA